MKLLTLVAPLVFAFSAGCSSNDRFSADEAMSLADEAMREANRCKSDLADLESKVSELEDKIDDVESEAYSLRIKVGY